MLPEAGFQMDVPFRVRQSLNMSDKALSNLQLANKISSVDDRSQSQLTMDINCSFHVDSPDFKQLLCV